MFIIRTFFVRIQRKLFMKFIMKTISKTAVRISVFVVIFSIMWSQTYAYELDFGGANYGYSYDTPTYDYGGANYGYSYDTPTYDYGGANYGYSYDTPTYDYGGANYGYSYDTPTYDYGGANYGYSYDTPTYDYGGANYGYTYADTSYDYGGANYGYSYDTPTYDYGGANYGYSYDTPTYDYGGANYGDYTPAVYEPIAQPTYDTYVDYGSSYSYVPYSYPTYSYSSPNYSYGGGYSYSYPSYNYTSHTSPRPTCTLVADDDRLTRGESTRLVWNTSHSDDQEINQGIGDVADDGSRNVSPTRTTTYTLFVEGDGGTITCNETIFVDEPRNDLSCDSFSVSDSRVEEGDRVTLTWRTTGADDVDINNGVGDVADDGDIEVTMHDDTTFTLTARDGNDSVTCTVSVNVDEDNNNNENPRCDSFTVSDSKVDEGDKVTLKWRTTNADSVRIDNGVGSVSDDGEQRVTVNDDTTFTLTVRNGNEDDTCKVKVSVDEDNNNNSSSLRCELTASDTRINSGDEVKLSWNNRNADRIVLKDNHGKEIADSRDDRDVDEDKDSVKVHPKKDTEYTLTAYDGNKKKTCTVDVNVGDTNITSVRGQGTIPLSYTPYTGFEAGPMLTFIFYGAIALWGAFVGYMLVLKKKAALALSHGVATTVHAGTVASTATAHAPAHESFIPVNLPMVEDTSAIVGTLETDSLRILEERANSQSVLISSDALRLIESQNGTHEEQAATLDRVIALAKAQYPKENGWIVINKEKIVALLS
jgi:hypothetical protein